MLRTKVAHKVISLASAAALAVLLLAVLLGGTACSNKPPDADPPPQTKVSQFRVTGKVTYKETGKPIPFGYVAFYAIEGVDAKGQTAPPSVGQIGEAGDYVIDNPPLGP